MLGMVTHTWIGWVPSMVTHAHLGRAPKHNFTGGRNKEDWGDGAQFFAQHHHPSGTYLHRSHLPQSSEGVVVPQRRWMGRFPQWGRRPWTFDHGPAYELGGVLALVLQLALSIWRHQHSPGGLDVPCFHGTHLQYLQLITDTVGGKNGWQQNEQVYKFLWLNKWI